MIRTHSNFDRITDLHQTLAEYALEKDQLHALNELIHWGTDKELQADLLSLLNHVQIPD